ncbi:MAG: hypothetical protein IPM82_21510 [Saprospiraceae bacterium]|nr:hypothetical protein [Saprospiraceae bacterium]
MKALTTIIILTFIAFSSLQSQTNRQLYGNVFNENGEVLIGATVLWEDTSIGTVTDEKAISGLKNGPTRLTSSFNMLATTQ